MTKDLDCYMMQTRGCTYISSIVRIINVQKPEAGQINVSHVND